MHKKCLNCASPQMEPVLPDSLGNKCRGGFLLSFADTAKAQVQAYIHFYLPFYSHASTFDLSLSTREDFNACYFPFPTSISTTSTSTSMSSCWRRQRSWSWTLRLAVSSKVFKAFTSYLLAVQDSSITDIVGPLVPWSLGAN